MPLSFAAINGDFVELFFLSELIRRGLAFWCVEPRARLRIFRYLGGRVSFHWLRQIELANLTACRQGKYRNQRKADMVGFVHGVPTVAEF